MIKSTFTALFLISALTLPTLAEAAPKKAQAAAQTWDGTWSGKWGGKSSGRVTVKGNKVTSYYFRGQPQSVGKTTVSGKTLRFGSDYSVTMTLTGDNSASAFWRGNGTAKAEMVRD